MAWALAVFVLGVVDSPFAVSAPWKQLEPLAVLAVPSASTLQNRRAQYDDRASELVSQFTNEALVSRSGTAHMLGPGPGLPVRTLLALELCLRRSILAPPCSPPTQARNQLKARDIETMLAHCSQQHSLYHPVCDTKDGCNSEWSALLSSTDGRLDDHGNTGCHG